LNARGVRKEASGTDLLKAPPGGGLWMTTFRERVKAELQEAIGARRVASWQFHESEGNECNVDTGAFLLRISFDERESSISTNLIFDKEQQWGDEFIGVESVSAMLPLWGHYVEELKSYRNKLEKDINVLRIIIDLMEAGKVSQRDIFFHFLGYNAGRDMRYKEIRRLT
jgi:hypothetical protein